MIRYDLLHLRRSMEKYLDGERFEHSLGVAYTAAALAMCHGADVEKAQVAGILHDCAKCVGHDKKLNLCRRHGIEVSDIERRNPFLLHTKVGSHVAKHQFDISDEDILRAICNHTTGRPAMSLLEKIIYISDYIEPLRGHDRRLTEIRTEAFRGDIDRATLMKAEDVLKRLEDGGREIDPATRETYAYYNNL